MTTQDNQSELDKLLNHVYGGLSVNEKSFDRKQAKQAIEAYVTTRVKEAERLARIDENENWARHIGAVWDNEVVNHEDVHKRLNELHALTTTTNGKEE